ncbi:MAG: competence/damage-inducible protein A [Chloroflexota bacterium]
MPRHLSTTELLSVGTELTVGETRDTNAGELAAELTELGLRVIRLSALPDDLAVVTEAFEAALERADLVVSTGGLGPTPDDLTREAIAAACGEQPAVDPELEGWLRELWERRGMPFPESNLKQAWLLPSARAIPNANGTAPGWFVERPDGRIVVALPGPPREMRPMWADHVVPLLRTRGAGIESVSRTYRLTGIGESQVAELLGEPLLRATNPIVATYARNDAVDVRIAAVREPGSDGSAQELVDATAAIVLDRLGDRVWATGRTTWPEAIDAALSVRGWTAATVEFGTHGALRALLSAADSVRHTESHLDPPAAGADEDALLGRATQAREDGRVDVGIALNVSPKRGDLLASVAIQTPERERRERRLTFLDGPPGWHRAAIVAAAALLRALGDGGPARD